MIKPERMLRIAIVGPRRELGATVQSLYELDLFHVVDYLGEDPEVKIGHPLPQAAEISQRLLKLRSIVRALHLEEFKTGRKVPVQEIEQTSDQAIATLEKEVNKRTEVRQALTSKIRELELQDDILSVFAEIGLPLDSYSDSESLSSFSGTAPSSITDSIEPLGIRAEVVEAPHGKGYAFSVFCAKKDSEAVQQALGSAGYQEMRPPHVSGSAAGRIAENEKEAEKLRETLSGEEEAIEGLREKYASLVLAAEEHYSIEIQKAEAPLRVATTQNSFTIDGWVPVSSLQVIKAAVAGAAGSSVTVETLKVSKEEMDEQAPVKLKNPRIAKPFELFIELMSTPLYREVDPTLFVFAVFPLFFGLMIGDLGYGICLMIAGLVMWKKLGKDSQGWKRLGQIVLAGGLFASLFGLFLFCDAFGLPFHPVFDEYGTPVLGGLSWESLGVHVPVEAQMEKLVDVKDLLAISVLAAWIHMTVGYALGFANDWHHDKKHAATKVLWLFILFGLFVQVLFMARGSELRDGIFLFFCSSFNTMTFSFSSITVSYVAILLIVGGIAGFFIAHGRAAMMELMEVLSLLANIISYCRIAAIGVAKGAMALAFNYVVASLMFAGGNIFLIAIGIFVLVLLQLIVFSLGSLSSGIQALRLNYVEFFLKFYTGGGVDFEPLGYKRKYSMKSEV